MNAAEAAMLCRYVAACCPQQKFDTFTPDAWGDLLGDLPYDLAKKAAARVAREQPFVSPSEIRTALRRMRADVRPALAQAIEQRSGHWDPEGAEEFADWQRRHVAIGAQLVDDALRSGIVPVARPELDDAMSPRVSQLVAGVIDAWPSVEA